MKLIFQYMNKYAGRIAGGMSIKLLGTMAELILPYILEHIIDDLVPLGRMDRILLWGILMILTAAATWMINIWANRIAVKNAHDVSYDVRKELFSRTLTLSGSQFDAFSLPSLTSRMTSDSYNVQSFVQMFQTMFVRAPIQMIGGIVITMVMDPVLSSILCIMLPILLVVIIGISMKSIPLYNRVQERLDDVVRILRENITGIRVVKALSRTEYETERYRSVNRKMRESDIKASTILALPGPFMQICLNIGLTLVVYIGAVRVNAGLAKPGVILAFLTYFNMILMGVMGMNRIFVMMSKASASADRIASVISSPEEQRILTKEEGRKPSTDALMKEEGVASSPDASDVLIEFDHVSFRYGQGSGGSAQGTGSSASGFASSASGSVKSTSGSGSNASDMEKFGGEEQENCLTDISFRLRKGESLGIIGPTGCGKTTIINLLMRFYDVQDGGVFVDGVDVRCHDKDELRKRFGIVMQNDVVFHDTIRRNISFGRDIPEEIIHSSAQHAQASEFIDGLDGTYDFMVDMKGMNLSGGQKQRVLIARALAAHPQILILDDASSALDYQTDARLRKALRENYADCTRIMIAQRISSIRDMTNIMVLDNGRCIGYGSHEYLLENCEMYRQIYDNQMGALA